MNKGKIVIQNTRQREKTMTGARSGFKIIYENILGNFGLLLSKERIFDNKYHFHQSNREKRSKKKKMEYECHAGGCKKGQEWVSCTLVVSQSAYIANIQ